MQYFQRIVAGLLAGIAVAAACPAAAQGKAPVSIDLPAQDLGDALRKVAALSNAEILFQSDDVAGLRAPLLSGRYTVEDAVVALLQGSRLEAEFRDGTVIVRGRTAASAVIAGAKDGDDSMIVITGTRIPGVASPSPTTVIDNQLMRDAGRSSLAEVIRDLPQNFGGGVNPGVGAGVPSASGINIGSSVSLNLRGIGPDATLTLLNGHRLSYNASRQWPSPDLPARSRPSFSSPRSCAPSSRFAACRCWRPAGS